MTSVSPMAGSRVCFRSSWALKPATAPDDPKGYSSWVKQHRRREESWPQLELTSPRSQPEHIAPPLRSFQPALHRLSIWEFRRETWTRVCCVNLTTAQAARRPVWTPVPGTEVTTSLLNSFPCYPRFQWAKITSENPFYLSFNCICCLQVSEGKRKPCTNAREEIARLMIFCMFQQVYIWCRII